MTYCMYSFLASSIRYMNLAGNPWIVCTKCLSKISVKQCTDGPNPHCTYVTYYMCNRWQKLLSLDSLRQTSLTWHPMFFKNSLTNSLPRCVWLPSVHILYIYIYILYMHSIRIELDRPLYVCTMYILNSISYMCVRVYKFLFVLCIDPKLIISSHSIVCVVL